MFDAYTTKEEVRPALKAKAPDRPTRIVEERWASKAQAPQEEAVEVLVYEHERDACAILVRALVEDGYAPVIARHGFEAFATTVVRRPALVIVAADMRRLSGASFVAEVRARKDLDSVRIVVVDPAAVKEGARDASRVVLWRAAPSSIPMARREIDRVLDGAPLTQPPRRTDGLAVVASIVFEAGRRLDERGRTAESFAAYRYAVELHPQARRYAAWAAWARFKLEPERAGEAALALLKRLVETDASLVDAHLLHARVLAATGKMTEARGVLFTAHARFPRDPDLTAELNLVDASLPRAAKATARGTGMFAQVRGFLARV